MLHGLKKFLEHKAYKIRRNALHMTAQAGSGHPTSVLSAADLVAALFFYAMHFNPDDITNPNNDHFILSKGHAAPALYAVWAELGKIPEHSLLAYRQFQSALEGHPTFRFHYAETATGSLGMGLSLGAGIAYAGLLDKRTYHTYVLMGDSELTEGSVWEAAEIAAYHKLNNLVGIIDCNRLGQSAETIHGHHVNRYAQKFEAFGWKTFIIDGHDMQQIASTFDKVRANHYDHPTMIIAKTIKGYGIESVENKEGFHGRAFTADELKRIVPEFDQRFASAAAFNDRVYTWKPFIPEEEKETAKKQSLSEKNPLYKKGELVSPRKAYGQALVALGADERVVVLDAEVKNSTGADLFEHKYPQRFVQCFLAEQNMVSMAQGLQQRGKIPFASTFASFFSRAYDQIRMAPLAACPLRLVGSHVGVSVGQDGPAQMGLSDMAFMRAVPGSVVLYPADAVSTVALVRHMYGYTDGISYLRTTRMELPVVYDAYEEFPIGGCKVVRRSDGDKAVIVAAGVTLHQALQAADQLQAEGIGITVIDAYSIKPLDAGTIAKAAHEAGNIIITVEDHYLQGGLGEAVSYALRNHNVRIECLAVTQVPMSGLPAELLAWAGIDAVAVVKKVKEVMK